MRALTSSVGLLVLTACAATGGEDAQSVGEDLSGNASAIDIGFNGGPDQFAAFPLFFQRDVHAGPRLCHTYLAWDVASEAPAMGNANSPEGKRAWFEYWLHEAAGQCDEALVTFKALSPSAPPSGGPSGQFARAFEAFLAQPWAQETGFTGRFAFTPWNEPNNPGGAGSGLGKVLPPDLAAQYYLAAEHACRVKGCKVAAGDLASNGDWWNDFEWNCADDNVASSQLCKVDSSENPGHAPASYLDRYKNYIANHATEYGLPGGFRPAYFAFHGWHDINEYLDTGNHCASYGDCATRRLLTSLGGSWGGVRIWDTEVGVDQDAAPISNTEQACGSAFLLRLTALSSRITRLYYTRLRGGTGELVDGATPRPALEVLAQRRTTYAGGCR
jgi:hypothetical protein